MGIWEDLELTGAGDSSGKISEFLNWFEGKDFLREDCSELIKKVKYSKTDDSKIEYLKKLFIFKKINGGNLRHIQIISESDLTLDEIKLKKIINKLKEKYKEKFRLSLFSLHLKEDNLSALIKVKSTKKREIVNRFTSNSQIPMTRALIIDKIGKKLNLYFSCNIFSRWDAEKISNDISNILVLNSSPNQEVRDLTQEFEKIISLQNLMGIGFKETNLQGSPRIKIDSRGFRHPICDSINRLRTHLIKDARFLLEFRLSLSSPLKIKVGRVLRKYKSGSEKKHLGIIYRFSDKNLTEEDLLFLEQNGIINNFTVLDPKAKKSLKDQMESLFNSKGNLDFWDPILNVEGRNLLREKDFIEDINTHEFKIKKNEIKKYIKSIFESQNYVIKEIKKVRSKNFSFFLINKEDRSFYVVFINKSDLRSVNSISNYCEKHSIYPIFIPISDIEKIDDKGYYQISIPDLLCERRIDELFISKIFQKSRNRYKEIRGRATRESLDRIRDILKSHPSKTHGLEAEKKKQEYY